MKSDESLAACQQFCKPYGVPLPVDVFARGRYVFLATEKVHELVDEQGLDPFCVGLLLGEAKPKQFLPSFALLDLLKDSDNRVVIADEAVWLFTCGRDVFMVKDKHGAVWGLGSLAKEGKNAFVKNVFDRGDYLRREERKKRK